ncbi:GAF and ANTAR domain-containing protein [Umezawaea endophytica]|uniref:GAF and ANTAR domain-containing protein n=1 Tax=Umezawaea endophytica TaxID=1654476 RepID=A0A9X3A133_9PSEU|nr:GAF and ANTAR domain-containing protein [Umezawaea endophytica]MCS7477568.1 GAF and ANTAR domain-containing protein [Umezawaea endophytica]
MADEQDWIGDKGRFVEDARRVAEEHPVPTSDESPLDSPLVAQFAVLTRSLLDAESLSEVLDRVLEACTRAIPAVDVASVTMRDPDGSFHTPNETDSIGYELDQVQYATGEGPCVDAARLPGPALAYSDDLANDPNWPVFGPAAAARGMGSLLSTALLPDSRPPQLTGALNLYSTKTHGFRPEDRSTALLLATHASLALAATHARTSAELKVLQLRKAVDTRDVIGQAKGILMHRRGITADEAFDVLRTTSQSLNVKLAELAGTLARRHTEIEL